MGAPKLGIKILKKILSLNNDLLRENTVVWVTVDELYSRYIKGGINQAFTREQLEYSIGHLNNDPPLSF